MHQLLTFYVNITGSSLVLSQALGLGDAHMITPVFQVPSLQKSLSGCNWAPVQHSQVQIRIVHRLLYTVNSCGWSPMCGLYSHGLRQQTTQAALSVQTLLFYDTDTTNSHWNTLTENTSLPDISQPLKTIYFVCRIIKTKVFSFTTPVIEGNVSSDAQATD